LAELYDVGPLHGLAQELLGTFVRATASALIVKLPYVAAAVPWHRDRTSVRPRTVCNLSLFLDDSNENGCVEIVPRSHLLPDDAEVMCAVERGPRQRVPAHAGDVVAHDVRAVHGSLPNTTAAIRRSVVIEFAPARLKLQRDG
jgi:ectoine hydroxylase-related dioxygenase (phytanoyl-CoA dioxygenase family)